MSKRWQIRRGTTSANNNFTGAVGEVTMDTTKNGLRLHNGSTRGGIEIPTAGTADYVIETQLPTAANNYTWYRKYRSGWVEQGGRSTGLDRTITLPITMSDANYVIITDLIGNISWNGYSHGVQNITTTGFRCWYDGDQVDPSNWSWQVSGMAA